MFTRDESLDELLSEFEDALFWPKRDKCFPSSASVDSMNMLFCKAATEMSRLAGDGKYNEADEVADALLELVAKNFMLYCRLIYMLSILCVILTIKVKVGFKHLNVRFFVSTNVFL